LNESRTRKGKILRNRRVLKLGEEGVEEPVAWTILFPGISYHQRLWKNQKRKKHGTAKNPKRGIAPNGKG